MVTGTATIKCPFCGKECVSAWHVPSHLEPKVTHISGGSKTTYHRVPETYEICGSCPNCGKSEKEMQKKFDGEEEITMDEHKKRLERFKSMGLPTKIVRKRD